VSFCSIAIRRPRKERSGQRIRRRHRRPRHKNKSFTWEATKRSKPLCWRPCPCAGTYWRSRSLPPPSEDTQQLVCWACRCPATFSNKRESKRSECCTTNEQEQHEKMKTPTADGKGGTQQYTLRYPIPSHHRHRGMRH
jgi:hypothetical protein